MSARPEPATPEARKPRGFEDRDAARLARERELIDATAAVYSRWGYEALDTGPFEYADAIGQFLPDDDRPNAGVFSFRDDDDRWIALRYDHTAPLARYVAQNRQRLPRPFKRQACGPVWRNEKPGPFRFREFTQCDADMVGVTDVAADAEMAAMACEVMECAGSAPGEGYRLRVNTRRFADALLAKVAADPERQRLIVLRALDKRDRLGEAGVAALLGEGRRDESGDFTAGAGLDVRAIDVCLQFLAAGRDDRLDSIAAMAALLGDTDEGEAGLEELRRMDAVLTALGRGSDCVRFDPSVVRGLDYYTGPVFEAEWLDGATGTVGGSVGGGGRYDDLIARFGGESVPATGFSLGVSRLAAMTMPEDARMQATGPVVVLAMDRDRMPGYVAMAAELRAAGLAAEVYPGTSGMRGQMKYADRRGAPAAVIEGEDERMRGVVTVKDLKAGLAAAAGVSGNEQWRRERPGQFEVPRADLVARVAGVLGAGAR